MIDSDLQTAFSEIHAVSWDGFTREEFVSELVRRFPPVWQVHPFREGNTRTVIMLLTFFVEAHGYFFDKDLLAACAGYVRDSLVMASIDQFSEPEHLERILLDAVCTEAIPSEDTAEPEISAHEKYAKYQKEPYRPSPHKLKSDH